jgi:hypothetical protein
MVYIENDSSRSGACRRLQMCVCSDERDSANMEIISVESH